MPDKKLQDILTHLLWSVVKLDDAPASAQSHLDYAIVELSKLVGKCELDSECEQVLMDAIEHMKIYRK